jgi:nucleotide-binding universal stress UspA family protein
MTTEFHKILVPVDFSPCSLEAYRTAVTLAQQFGGELVVLHVIDTRILASLADVSPIKADALTKVLHKKVRLQFRSLLSGGRADVKARQIVVTGVPFHEIVKAARLEQVDLIVMGRYGGTGELEKIFFGSTVEKVIRVAPCAVLSIPLIEVSSKPVS